ncbi:proline--tRNA ligase [Enterobacteriaceae endosymbiont of Donacia cincticornis]|uniref:proline--tRNA ligase n=1 Tax=Enterobacteriaceae endosymbiont of Donacia cincticornis TaxID=2675773 RepID=UPI0014498ED8|nr:proline--tRNA ligase [Enterobacteriaceae endosymbiont of Donacia cincticornis]QJC36103.1 proline--tRNA ligase [Enterobacteriaceae endosymbiont of Donacia cincticornis]
MLTTKYVFFTSKNRIDNNHLNSFNLMIKSGIIRKLSSGIYIWLPTGLRIINNLKKIIRYFMNSINAIELILPILNPINIWDQSGRSKDYGKELFKIVDYRKYNFVLSPTNEEVITYLINNEIQSYKSLPVHFYQIQTKFRNEMRSRLGVVRAKEFLMKDSYSFHMNEFSLKETYNIVLKTYKKIFDFLNINYVIVKADNNIIGGNISHEFHILSKNGENLIALSEDKKYIMNRELGNFLLPKKLSTDKKKILKRKFLIIKDCLNYKELAKKINISIKNIIKIIIIKITNKNNPFIALMIRADYKLNIYKIKKINIDIIKILSNEEIEKIFKINIYFINPFLLKIPIIGDYSIINMYNFIIGTNIKNQYSINTNWDINLPLPKNIQDIRYVNNNDITPDGKSLIKIKHSIEIAHIFQIGTKYSKLIHNYIYNKEELKQLIYMGCYGLGISRLIAAIIEKNYDFKGIYWPNEFLAPFLVAIIPINMYKFSIVKKNAFLLYKKFKLLGIEVIIDDRKENPGVMFTDMDLIGVPHIIVINNFNITNNNIEYKCRKTGSKKILSINLIIDFIFKKIKKNKCFNIFFGNK